MQFHGFNCYYLTRECNRKIYEILLNHHYTCYIGVHVWFVTVSGLYVVRQGFRPDGVGCCFLATFCQGQLLKMSVITSLTLIMLCSVIGVIGGNFTLRDREALEAVCLDVVSLEIPDPQWCDHSCCNDINTLGMQSAIQGTNNNSSIISGVHLIGDGNRPCYTPRLAMHKKCLRGRPSGWAVKLCLLRFHFGRVSFKTLMHVSFFFWLRFIEQTFKLNGRGSSVGPPGDYLGVN